MVSKTELQASSIISLIYSGNLDKAQKKVQKLPRTAFSLFVLGWICQLRGQHPKAIKYFEQSLQKNPINVDALIGLSTSYLHLKEIERAVECAEHAVLIEPKNAKSHQALGTALTKQDVTLALRSFAQAFELAHTNLGLEHRQEILKDILTSWGGCYVDLRQFEEAQTLLELALKLSDTKFDTLIHKNLASVYAGINEVDKAIESACIAQQDDNPDIVYESMYQEGMLELLRGNYRKGWRLCEARLHYSNTISLPCNTVPYWDGHPLDDSKKLLVYQEQGFGDLLQFSRYIPLVKERAPNIDIEVRSNFHTETETSPKQFMKHNYPEVDRVLVKGEKTHQYGDYDYIVSFMSLPHIFKTTLAYIPEVPDFTPHYHSREIEQLKMFDIGIFWSGSSHHANNSNRSIEDKTIREFICANPHFSFVSLQIDRAIPEAFDARHLMSDFSSTLQLLQKCRLIITVDSMIAHLAGSAKIPTFTLHAYAPDWRWLLDRDDCPWYPTIRNFRQKTPYSWGEVLVDVEREANQQIKNNIKLDRWHET